MDVDGKKYVVHVVGIYDWVQFHTGPNENLDLAHLNAK